MLNEKEMYRKQSRRVGERADVTGWGCETRSGRESGRLKCRSAETPWALVSAGLAVFEKGLGHWSLRPAADPCHQSISRPALWRAGDSWDGRAAVAVDTSTHRPLSRVNRS